MESINFYDAKWVRSAELLSNYFFHVRCFWCTLFSCPGVSIFQSQYFAPRYRLRWFRFFKSRFSRLKTVCGGFYFSKTSTSRLKNIYDGLNVFQKPALHASIPPTAVPIYSKAGDSRRKNSVCCSLKKTQWKDAYKSLDNTKFRFRYTKRANIPR